MAALVAVFAPGAAAAPAAPPVLTTETTLVAAKTAYVRVRISRPVDLMFYLERHPPVFSGSGPVAVALLPDRVGSPERNLLIVRTNPPNGAEVVESPASGGPRGSDGSPGRYLRPGVYRLFLATRGGGSVRLRLPGQLPGQRRLAATAPVPWAFREVTAPKDPAGNAPSTWEATLDYDGRQPGPVFAALWFHSAVTAYAHTDACFYRGPQDDRAAPLCLGGYGRGPIARAGPAVDKVDRLWAGAEYYEPPGRQSFRVVYASGGIVKAAGAMMFFLPAAA